MSYDVHPLSPIVRIADIGDSLCFSGPRLRRVHACHSESTCSSTLRDDPSSDSDRKQKTGVSAPNAKTQSPCSFSCSSPLWVTCLFVVPEGAMRTEGRDGARWPWLLSRSTKSVNHDLWRFLLGLLRTEMEDWLRYLPRMCTYCPITGTSLWSRMERATSWSLK